MNRCKMIMIVLFLLCAGSATAQFTISKVKPSSIDPKTEDSVKQSNINNEFFNKSKWDAERRRLRKERNFVEFNPTLNITQTQFENWAPGGDNTFSGRSTLYVRHIYNRAKLNMDTRVEGRYGISLIEDKPFKNEDFLKVNFAISWAIKHNWSYSANAEVVTQFTNGYRSRDDKTLVSGFMAPGTINMSVGFRYARNGFSMTISPIGGTLVTVLNTKLSDQGAHGVEKGRKSRGEPGPSFRADYDKTFCKNVFRYRSSIYSFTNMKITPTVRWDNTLDIKATKFLTTTIFCASYYDRFAKTPKSTRIQLNYAFTIGLSYRFVNK